MQRFGHADAGHQAQPGQAAEATGVQAQHRQVDVRGQRRGPGTATTAAATGLAFGQKDAHPALGRAATQQFGVGGVHRPGHLQVVQQRQNRGRQAGADRVRVHQVDRSAPAVALASTPLDGHAGGPKSLNTLPNGRPGLAQLTGQGVAGQATGSEFGQQLAIVHGSFHEVRTELCGKAASDARHAGFRRGFQRGAGFGLESGTHLPLTWMSSMRRYAHCLILLMMPFAASATAALDDSRGACVSSNGDAASQRAPAASAAAATTKPAPVRPAANTSTGGGGSDDDANDT
ncbi:hypothetical protein G6F40_013573 [Rhizopus arrhizus]|nr:hypothetical protein G6F40_013573 [Rhizopus arrhizus]